MVKKFVVIKPFNHNVVYCKCIDSKNECIILGKGVGFGVKEGQYVNDKNIEKVLYIFDEDTIRKFNSLIENIDGDIVAAAEEIIEYAASCFESKLNENLHITLLDHLNFAVIRYKSAIEIKNPFLYEIKSMYKKEFEIAKKAVELINNKLNINLPEDEAAFIAMHIHAAANNIPISQAALTTNVIAASIQYIEDSLGINIDKESIEYIRLLTHIRFAVDRARKKISIENLLIDTIKEKYNYSFQIAKNLSEMLNKEYFIEFSEGEIGYIALHLQTIIGKLT
ncbi:transcriptional antiterminator, BglG family [Caloramator quimbayensis]|uniref:Transcriptional antiterminator, BglG family n=1 Tax=Caloramator quimbayensis TaxID=1147123 RepID=A0A1T4Y088_9CLOT|nr:PRD domain-containing protein [Caloramator quimbayensis]SKA95190.1 transcriptional antiterminator, BglG family [Caloramator quimbayensis]